MLKRVFFTLIISALFAINANAQCSMCTLNAENGAKNGNTQTKGINRGVLYLLSLPFLLATGAGVVWYTKFRDPSSVKK